MAADWELDASLLARWRAGDQGAGERLFQRHGRAIARFFETTIQRDVEDLVQQTFLNLVRARDRIKAGVTVRAYLLTTARNVLIDHLRRCARRPQDRVSAQAFEAMSIAELDPGPTTIIAKRQEQRLLLEGLRAIPLEQQIALELYYWEELNAAEIAAIVGVSHSAMRSRLAKVGDASSDLIQRTFLACVEGKHRFRGDESFRSDLFAIAYRQLCRHYRGRARLAFESLSTCALDPSFSGMVVVREEQRLFLAGLREIPLELQVVLELHYWEECSVAEIAAALEIPSETVTSRLRRGSEQLRAAVERLAA